mgnify:CR=1 FL=1
MTTSFSRVVGSIENERVELVYNVGVVHDQLSVLHETLERGATDSFYLVGGLDTKPWFNPTLTSEHLTLTPGLAYHHQVLVFKFHVQQVGNLTTCVIDFDQNVSIVVDQACMVNECRNTAGMMVLSLYVATTL